MRQHGSAAREQVRAGRRHRATSRDMPLISDIAAKICRFRAPGGDGGK
ncbi:hypothetical protein SLNWT_1521 [Streptomyces albus]|uniref:Uncharacterized protein n=1 Tax=Streptomyces albus (strain ATCC 21838 / DSM 41398 / FERM P-419 / JCM 4703 / NBRC 107858) TaxID=1081613 RepID=A0A0B5EV13_STRA4|nr:hypothetical protein SLNWT_1521 [Streptomyces albus]